MGRRGYINAVREEGTRGLLSEFRRGVQNDLMHAMFYGAQARNSSGFERYLNHAMEAYNYVKPCVKAVSPAIVFAGCGGGKTALSTSSANCVQLGPATITSPSPGLVKSGSDVVVSFKPPKASYRLDISYTLWRVSGGKLVEIKDDGGFGMGQDDTFSKNYGPLPVSRYAVEIDGRVDQEDCPMQNNLNVYPFDVQ